MILSSKNEEELFLCLDKIGMKNKISKDCSVLIKINLARPAQPNHPRTDSRLLSKIIEYIYLNVGKCTLAESANGYLKENLEKSGLRDILEIYDVNIVDLDLEEAEELIIDGEKHYLPKCLKEYDFRIAVPATSKRPDAIFSNNVKLFVGAVPRRMYQIGDMVEDWRPRVHLNLHKSVANIFRAIQRYSPFEFFINGGLSMEEFRGEFQFDRTLIGDNAVELDLYVLNNIFIKHEVPDYLKILK